MTMVPQGGFNFSHNPWLKEHTLAYVAMGQTAENVATLHNVPRQAQEQMALESHRKAAAAREAGWLRDEIAPVKLDDGSVVDEDGYIRPHSSFEALAALKPAFAFTQGQSGARRPPVCWAKSHANRTRRSKPA